MAEKTVMPRLRPGEVHSPPGILYGRLPGYHLSANGRGMAAAAADFFAERPVVAVFASPLERAQETARPVAERLNLRITTDDRLIESQNVLEGKAVSLKHLAELRRTRVGEFSLEQAVTLEGLEELARDGRAEEALAPALQLLPELPRVIAPLEAVGKLLQGRAANLPEFSQAPLIRIFAPDQRLLAIGSRIAGRLGSAWYAVYVDSPKDRNQADHKAFRRIEDYQQLATDLGARVVVLKQKNIADALVQFAQRENISHVVFGQSARSRVNIMLRGSVINRFLAEMRESTVQVVPMPKGKKQRQQAASPGTPDVG